MPNVYAITTEAEEALAAATAETLLQLRGVTTARARIITWSVSFDGVDASAAPVVVELLRQTTDGTATGATEVPLDEADPASALVAGFHSFTAEPTAGSILEQYEVHPQGGCILREYPPGREPVVAASASSRLGIRVTAPAAVNAVAFLHWEE